MARPPSKLSCWPAKKKSLFSKKKEETHRRWKIKKEHGNHLFFIFFFSIPSQREGYILLLLPPPRLLVSFSFPSSIDVYVCDFESPTHPVRAGGARITPHTHLESGKGAATRVFLLLFFFRVVGGVSLLYVRERPLYARYCNDHLIIINVGVQHFQE